MLSVLRELRSVPLQYLTRDLWVTPCLEWGFSCKNLDTQHPKGKDVGGFGFWGCIAARWDNDLWSEPPRVPDGRRSYREAGIGVDESRSIIRQPSAAMLVNENVRLRNAKLVGDDRYTR